MTDCTSETAHLLTSSEIRRHLEASTPPGLGNGMALGLCDDICVCVVSWPLEEPTDEVIEVYRSVGGVDPEDDFVDLYERVCDEVVARQLIDSAFEGTPTQALVFAESWVASRAGRWVIRLCLDADKEAR